MLTNDMRGNRPGTLLKDHAKLNASFKPLNVCLEFSETSIDCLVTVAFGSGSDCDLVKNITNLNDRY
jgi:hypothetical protein